MTTLGIGDIIMITLEERLFSTITMMVGTLVFAYIIGSIGDAV